MSPRVLVIGAGGLGCPAVLALALEGVRDVSVADADLVEPSNLHRQLWHHDSDVGRPKVESLAARAQAAFPELRLEALRTRVDASNAAGLFRAHDWVLDGTDRVSVKLMLSDVSVRTGVPLVYGGVVKFEGLVFKVAPGGPCLRCVYEEAPRDEDVATCSSAGVLGSLAGVVGALQVEAGLRGTAGTLVRVDGLTGAVRRVKVAQNPGCPMCGVEVPQRARQDA